MFVYMGEKKRFKILGILDPTNMNYKREIQFKKLVIFLEGNKEKIAHQGVIGPFDLGTQLLLTCKAIGGKPSPKVTWWYNNTLLDTVMESTIYGIARNTVHLPPLTLQDQYKELTCQAVNTNMFPTVSSSVIMKVKGMQCIGYNKCNNN
ncbi:hypothetical protein Avbf_13945 [Armadillidium vulgare]|nr:hypothetical protein Avbf_13945 [Armadillidium vulgare]